MGQFHQMFTCGEPLPTRQKSLVLTLLETGLRGRNEREGPSPFTPATQATRNQLWEIRHLLFKPLYIRIQILPTCELKWADQPQSKVVVMFSWWAFSFPQNCKEKIDTCAAQDIIFVLYSITDRSSFQEATLIVKYLHEAKNIPPSAIFLIASKADLKRLTEVTEFEGKLFAVNTGCSFYQLSNSESFFEHNKIIKKAYLRATLSGSQKPPKSPALMRRLKGGFKNKGNANGPTQRSRSGSVEF